MSATVTNEKKKYHSKMDLELGTETRLSPMQIGIVILGDWKNTRKALEYLILYLNTRQDIFEYQIITVDCYMSKKMRSTIGEMKEAHDLLECMLHAKRIKVAKEQITECLQTVAEDLAKNIVASSPTFDSQQTPSHYIFISTSEHEDGSFFQHDGINGYHAEDPYHGALILVGHHSGDLTPPTILEYIFKFIFRISVRWKHNHFTNDRRHYCTKGCLFDYVNDINLVRYLVLHNYICTFCKKIIGLNESDKILNALDFEYIYSSSVERHPAKVSSQLGFNLTMTKGLYKTRTEIIVESFNKAFVEKLGSMIALLGIVAIAVLVGLESYIPKED